MDAPSPPPQHAAIVHCKPAALRKACNACSASKVKCDGKMPCFRCSSKNLPCVYQPELKRGRHPTSLLEAPPRHFLDELCLGDNDKEGLGPTCSVLQRRRFRIVFSLFKFHCDETRDGDWFTTKFNQLLGEFVPNSKPHLMLAYFLYTHKISTTALSVANGGSRCTPLPRLVNLPRSLDLPPRVPPAVAARRKLKYLGYIHMETGATRVLRCVVSPKLAYLEDGSNLPFGDAEVEEDFFPWGGDVLAAICGEDSQVLSYLRDVAFTFNAQERRTGFTSHRTAVLPNREASLHPATSSNSNNSAALIPSVISCQVSHNISTGASGAMFELFECVVEEGEDNDVLLSVPPLPDLELGPWRPESWLADLTRWAKRT